MIFFHNISSSLNWQPSMAALIFFALIFLILISVFLLYLFLYKRNLIAEYSVIFSFFKDKNKKNMQGQFVSNISNDNNNYLPNFSAILEILSFGLILYRNDGWLTYANSPAKDFFNNHVPESTTEFLTEYGNSKGLNAAFLLQDGERKIFLELNKKKLDLHFRDFHDENNVKIGILITIQDVTEREQLENQRKQFVANVSHELKTPLTTIKTYSESLLEWGLDEKKKDSIRKDITRINEDALRMEHLVADLLLLSSIDSRGMRYHFSETDATILIKQVVERLRNQADLKNITLELISLSQLPTVIADSNSLERVITNLVTNAIKYSNENSKITVYLSCPLDNVHINVSDSGYGIASQHLPHLFDRFYRVDVTGNRKYGGTGLGLAIAKELVELHHGRITVKSSLGKGSEFHVLLPSAGRTYKQALDLVRDKQLNEDDPLLLYTAKELLYIARDLGYQVDSLTELREDELDDILSFVAPNKKNEYLAHRDEIELINNSLT